MFNERLKAAILKELGLADFAITPATLADELPGWDSLSHARILAAVEREFAVRFKSLDVLRLKNLGDLQKLVEAKITAK